MTNFAEKLLTLSFQNYTETRTREFRFTPPDSDLLNQGLCAVEELQENDYIQMLSDNLDSDTLTLVEGGIITNDIVLWFEITGKGLEYCQSHLKL